MSGSHQAMKSICDSQNYPEKKKKELSVTPLQLLFPSPKTYQFSYSAIYTWDLNVNFYKHLIFLLICIFIILQMVSTETLGSASFFSF